MKELHAREIRRWDPFSFVDLHTHRLYDPQIWLFLMPTRTQLGSMCTQRCHVYFQCCHISRFTTSHTLMTWHTHTHTHPHTHTHTHTHTHMHACMQARTLTARARARSTHARHMHACTQHVGKHAHKKTVLQHLHATGPGILTVLPSLQSVKSCAASLHTGSAVKPCCGCKVLRVHAQRK